MEVQKRSPITMAESDFILWGRMHHLGTEIALQIQDGDYTDLNKLIGLCVEFYRQWRLMLSPEQAKEIETLIGRYYTEKKTDTGRDGKLNKATAVNTALELWGKILDAKQLIFGAQLKEKVSADVKDLGLDEV